MQKEEFHRLCFWMEERQRIYQLRQAGRPWPWTTDPILQKYHFCNVYREQDRVTVWLREHWREPHRDHPNLWFAMCIARQINWPPTLEEMGFPDEWRPAQVIKTMTDRSRRGDKVYTSAYMLRSDPGDKFSYTVLQVLDPVWKRRKWMPWVQSTDCSIQTATEHLTQFSGWGGFLSYEVATDLRHTRYLAQAPDVMTWANPGPGAQRGLHRLHGRNLNTPLPTTVFVSEMRELLVQLRTALDSRIIPTLEMRDVEHSLCEFDKYRRAQQQANLLGLRLYLRQQKSLIGA